MTSITTCARGSAPCLCGNAARRGGIDTRQGFTLLEVIIALGLVGMILMALSVSMFTAFRAQRSVEALTEQGRQGRLAMSVMQRDLWCTAPPTGVLAASIIGIDGRDSLGDADTLTFYTTTAPQQSQAGRGDLMQVTYRLVEPGELTQTQTLAQRAGATAGTEADNQQQGRALVRETITQLLASQTQAPVQQVLARGVSGLNLRYFDGVQWLEEWDSTLRENELPPAVEITLELMQGSNPNGNTDNPRQLVNIIALPAATMTLTPIF